MAEIKRRDCGKTPETFTFLYNQHFCETIPPCFHHSLILHPITLICENGLISHLSLSYRFREVVFVKLNLARNNYGINVDKLDSSTPKLITSNNYLAQKKQKHISLQAILMSKNYRISISLVFFRFLDF